MIGPFSLTPRDSVPSRAHLRSKTRSGTPVVRPGVGNPSVTVPSELTETLKIATFNCHGFKQNISQILCLFKSCDILCLTETWLRPNELHSIDDALNQFDCSVFSKSGMDDMECTGTYSGRPFGGVCVVSKKLNGIYVRPIEIASNRIVGVNLMNDNGTIIQSVYSVYFPHDQAADAAEIYVGMNRIE